MADETVLSRLAALFLKPPLSGRGYVRATAGARAGHSRRLRRVRGSGPRAYDMNGERTTARRRRQIAAGTLRVTR